MLNEAPAKPDLRKLAIVLAVFLVAVGYLLPAALRGDLLWFNPSVDGQPGSIIIYHYSNIKTIRPGDKGFQQIVDAAQSEIPKVNALPAGGPGVDTISDVRSKRFAVELRYDKPVTIHSTFALGHPDTILIPLDGWEADAGNYYLAANGVFGAWLPVLPPASIAHIKAVVVSAGY